MRLMQRQMGVSWQITHGKDFTDRFPTVTAAVAALPAAGAIIDGEIVAFDETGKPDFYTLLLRRASGVYVWCFDLLGLGGDDLRSLPLEERKKRLAALLSKVNETQDAGELRRCGQAPRGCRPYEP